MRVSPEEVQFRRSYGLDWAERVYRDEMRDAKREWKRALNRARDDRAKAERRAKRLRKAHLAALDQLYPPRT